MKKITLFIVMLSFLSMSAQKNLIFKKEHERYMMSRAKFPVTHKNDRLQNPKATAYFEENFDAGIPASWSVVDNAGTGAIWQGATDYNGNTLDGTPFAFVNSDAAGSVDVDTELISPEVDVSAATALFLSFEHYFNSYSGDDVGDVDVYDGTGWVNVYTTSSDVGAWGAPDYQMIEVTAYKNANFKVRFHYYNANWDWYWAVDNVKLFEPDADDLAVTESAPATFTANASFLLDANIYNNGTNTQNDFDVTFEIIDASSNSVFSETVNVTGANLASSGNYMVAASGQPSLPAGEYTYNVTVALSGDANNANDTYTQTLNIVDFPSTYQDDLVYSYVAYDGDSSGDLNNLVTFDSSANVTAVGAGALNTADFLVSGTFVNDVLVAVEYATNMVYFIDGNGNAYKFRKLKGDIGSEVVTGVAFNSTLGAFISSGTNLYAVSLSDISTTIVGPFNTTGGLIIGIDIDDQGNMYGVDLGDDKFYSIDVSTGGATEIGDLGVDIRYAQDIGSNPDTGNMYGTLYVDNVGGGLYSIDKSTGAATLIGAQQEDEYTVCAIKGGNLSGIAENHIEGLLVYPNPIQDVLNISAGENILNISVIDVTGKKVISIDNEGMQAQINLSELTKGIYILKITTDKTVGSSQIIKK
jgi:hypothetical protein